MSYGLSLVRLPAGVNRADAYRAQAEKREQELVADAVEALDPAKLEAMDGLVASLKARYPSLELFAPDWSAMEPDARERSRGYRELNEPRLSVHIHLWQDSAGVSLNALDTRAERLKAARLLWGCLAILAREGGYTIHDPQIGKIVNLEHDFAAVAHCAYGLRNAKR